MIEIRFSYARETIPEAGPPEPIRTATDTMYVKRDECPMKLGSRRFNSESFTPLSTK